MIPCFVARQVLSPPIEGHHIASKRIIEAALQAGIAVHIITIEKDVNITLAAKDWSVVKLRHHQDRIGFLPSFVSVLEETQASFKIVNQIKSYNYDLVHVLNLTKEIYTLSHRLMRVKKPLLLHFFHSSYVLADDVFFVRNLALRFGLFSRLVDSHALTVNQSLFNFLIKELDVDPERVHYAPYPVNVEIFKPLEDKYAIRERYGLPSDHHIIAYVGSLHPARGLSILIRAFHHILSRFPKTILYISHPSHRNEKIYETSIVESVKELGIHKNVLIAGLSSHVEELYNMADIVVLPFERPYWIDPPLVLLEAMSSGAAVVTTSVGAINDVVKDRENAVITRAGDPRILAENIIELIKDSNMRHKMGQKARETIIKDYSYEVVGNKLLEIYDSILNNSS